MIYYFCIFVVQNILAIAKIKGGFFMTTGFYAGSFDPFTYGHLHVVKKSLMLFDKVIIGIATHP